MQKLIIFDMDGVIFEHNSGHNNFWLDLHKLFGTYEEGIAATEKYLFTDYETLVEVVVHNLWKGKPAQPFLDLVSSMHFLPGVEETMKILHERGYTLAIITSGPSHLLERAKQELGIDFGHGNHLDIEDGIITGRSRYPDGDSMWPIRADNKVPYAKKICDELGIALSDVVMIGDEKNDLPLFKEVGVSIAFNTERKDLIEAATHHVPGKNLKEILSYI